MNANLPNFASIIITFYLPRINKIAILRFIKDFDVANVGDE